MVLAEYIFWISLALLLYTYLGYPLLVYLFLKFTKDKSSLPTETLSDWPSVSWLVACYNEEAFIADKIKNLRALDYPSDRIEIIFVTDGSTDQTNDIIENAMHDDGLKIKLYYEAERKGKQHAVNRVIEKLNGDIIVFNDCNTIVNKVAVKNLVRHFNQLDTGVVTGEKSIIVKDKDELVSSGEGLYWKYECFLKQLDSDFYSCVGSPGELFAIRKSLYKEVPEDIAIEDFYLSVSIVLEGYKNIYEHQAVAKEYGSASLREEMKRKRRIASGAYQTVFKLTDIYKSKYLKFIFLYVSHRLFRWIVAPISLIAILVCSLFLWGSDFEYQWLIQLQFLFYLMAALGFIMRNVQTSLNFLSAPFYFVFMHICLFLGFYDFIRKKNNVIWDKAERKST